VAGEMWVSCKSGCLPLPLEGEELPRAAGSLIEGVRVDFPGAREYLSREGRETRDECCGLF